MATFVARVADAFEAVAADVKALYANKQATLVSGTNIKTVNGESLLGSGNLTISGSGVQQVFVQDTAPTVPGGVPYLWFQTGLGPDGTDMTVWVEDGL